MDDGMSTIIGRRRGPSRRGPLVVTNPGNDSDEDSQEHLTAIRTNYLPPPLPSPRSPHSEQFSLPSTSYHPPSHIPPTDSVHTGHSNPSLSSPSGSSSPAVESTPPPSTPGQSAPPEDSGNSAETPKHAPLDERQQNMGPRTMMDRSRSSPNVPHPTAASRPAPAPIMTNATAYVSPINHKVLLTVTADCDNFTYLDITGAANAAMIKEKMFSKLQISDDQQPFFSVYRTEIGEFAIGEALSDERLMEICREEGDAKGSLKFLVQHSSASVHLPPALPRSLVTNHVPPVLPYQESFGSPSQRARSTKSNHETMSSISDVENVHTPDDLDQLEREKNRNTFRPSPQQPLHAQHFGNPIPPSPRGRRLMNVREPSPGGSRRPMSPLRALPNEMVPSNPSTSASPLSGERSRAGAPGAIPPLAFSPTYYDDGSITSPPIRNRHAHSASDAAAERDRVTDAVDRQYLGDREARTAHRDEKKLETNKRRPKHSEHSDSSSRKTQEPWVLVPSPNVPRSVQQALSSSPSSSHTLDNTARYSPFSQGLYSSSRSNLPQAQPLPRHPIPPVPPSSESGRHKGRQIGQAVPLNWANKCVPGDKTDQRSFRLYNAKSMDNLRMNNYPSASSNGTGAQKVSQDISRPSADRLKQLPIAQVSSSFMNMEPSPRRDPQSPSVLKSYDVRTNFSPTNYAPSRPSPMNTQTQASYGQSPQPQHRPLPVHIPVPNTGSNYLNAPSGSWRQSPEELHPRPHSALDDIGASPAPARPFRPLPQTGGMSGMSALVDVETALDPEDSRSPRITSPHHPYAASASHSMRTLPSTALSAKTTNASSINALAEPIDMQTVTAGSPGSPRRAPLDSASQDSSDTPKSFVSLTQDSPVYDGDSESTLKREGNTPWIGSYMLSSSSGDGTLKPQDKAGRMQDRRYQDVVASAIPPRVSREVSSTSSTTTRSTTTETDEGGQSDDDWDDKSLWQTPLKHDEARRPILSLNTEGGSSSSALGLANSVSRSSPTPHNRPRKNVSIKPGEKGQRSNRESQFIKASQKSAMSRPRPEEITDHIEAWFPDHDVDKPLIDTTSGGSSPTAVEPSTREVQGAPPEKEKKSKHKKSIRYVAAEAKKKIDQSLRSDSSSMTFNLRRRNTKLWGGKLEEVTTSQIPSVPTLPESPTNVTPKPIFKWVRGELIGKGTYGRVYLALNATTGEMIAVKQVEIPQTEADRDDKRQISVVEALKLESETLKDLDHPNIVQYLGFERTPEFLSIFLEYVPGGSVAACLRKHGKFEDQVARSFTGQILAGLEYLHNNGIIHRDLKADNILVDPSGICKISDFGISKRTEDINENNIHTSMQGSVFWMAPEVVQAARKGEKHGYNGKVDIWSLGCVVLEMWAGRRPWQDVAAIAVLFELITKKEAPPIPSDVVLSPDADDFRRKCFATRPENRPSATELRQHPYLILQPGWTFTGFK